MESGCPLYFSCITGQGHFSGFVWKGRLDWAIKEQENMSGLEHETHKSIPLLSYIYRALQLYQILRDWLSLKKHINAESQIYVMHKEQTSCSVRLNHISASPTHSSSLLLATYWDLVSLVPFLPLSKALPLPLSPWEDWISSVCS